ncbi:MAG: serine hydrolase domain-containing protein [Flavobacteriaceae bacterium]
MRKLVIGLFISILIFFALSCHNSFKKDQNKILSETIEMDVNAIDSLQNDLMVLQNKNVLPGFVTAIFTKDTILFNHGFGFADLKEKKPYTPEHVQIIASVSKTLIGIALMRTVEDSLVGLDDDINTYLPFQVKNPYFPESVITLRQLATHTSSIGSTENSDEGYRFENPLRKEDFPEAYTPILHKFNHTEPLSLQEFLENKLTIHGKWYEKSVFLNERPGANYEYSNLGATLLAYIIETVTKTPYHEYTQKNILDPLRMNHSTWDLETAKTWNHVTYYNELKNELPKYSIISYPDGGLYSNTNDLINYTQEMMKGYEGESSLLSKASFNEMMSKQSKLMDMPDGLCWDLSFPCCIGHAGNDFGTNVLLYFSPENGIGKILMTNMSIGDELQDETFYEIFNTLFKYHLLKSN